MDDYLTWRKAELRGRVANLSFATALCSMEMVKLLQQPISPLRLAQAVSCVGCLGRAYGPPFRLREPRSFPMKVTLATPLLDIGCIECEVPDGTTIQGLREAHLPAGACDPITAWGREYPYRFSTRRNSKVMQTGEVGSADEASYTLQDGDYVSFASTYVRGCPGRTCP